LASCGESTEEEAKEGEATEQSQEEGEDETEADVVSIVGEWQCADLDMGMEVPADRKAAMDAAIKQMVDNTKYTFKEDGSLILSTPEGNEMGTYSVEGMVLKTKMASGKEETINIAELTASSLKLKIEEEGMNGSMSFTR
jgi:hypothetical protein